MEPLLRFHLARAARARFDFGSMGALPGEELFREPSLTMTDFKERLSPLVARRAAAPMASALALKKALLKRPLGVAF